MQLEFRGRVKRCIECAGELRPWHLQFCSEDCYTVGYQASLERRFWAKVDKSGECWIWNGTRLPSGYGVIGVRGNVVYAHRLAYEWANAPIPEGLVIRHGCDTPPCVRPDHLQVGTQLENVSDAIQRGRFRHIPEESKRQPTPDERARGDQVGTAVLSDTDVSEILSLYAKGNISQRDLGARFGVHQSTISYIVLRKRWLHVATSD